MAESLDLAEASMVPISVIVQMTTNFASQMLVQCNLYRRTVIPGSNSILVDTIQDLIIMTRRW